jgi:hypothetical protein
MTDRRFAKDVARELDKRNRRRRMLFLLFALALAVLAVLYVRCGSGWGLGGNGKGAGNGSGTTATDAGPRRCSIRVAAGGITVDGKPATRNQALEICRRTAGADVVITGDAREGDWAQLKAALESAKVQIFVRH